jgi:S1-C subfamily serine protease
MVMTLRRMRRNVLSLVSLAALAVPASAAADLPEVVDRAAGSVVGIEVAPADVRPAALNRSGVGFVVDQNGHVVTTAAVVGGAETVRVRLDDGRRLDARVVGVDTAFGVAVIELAARPPAFPLGRADLARLGEPVATVTRAGDGRVAVRAGILSARGGRGAPVLDDHLQVDFDLDASFLGAPLLDGAGRVLGLFTVRAGTPPHPNELRSSGTPGPPRRRGVTDLGATRLAAVPMDVVSEAVRQILERGHVDWPWLGMALQEVAPSGAGGVARVEVVAADPGSPAAAGGVAPGDLVLSVDGRRVRRVADVQRAILLRRAGQHVTLVVERSGQSQTLDVVAQARPGP